jgi:hypothetical protein
MLDDVERCLRLAGAREGSLTGRVAKPPVPPVTMSSKSL